MNIKKIDYSAAYNDFWSRKDRAGSESYENRDALVDQIISTVGYGRVLDIGCGEGRLVRALVEKGVDAYGIDVSSVAIDRANQYCPGRFKCTSVLDLPFNDKHFDAIISTDCLEHIHPDDVPAAIAELRRVCNQYAFFTIATTNDRDGHWHLTVMPREWWEQKFFEAGFIRHPDYYRINSLQHISTRPWQITLPLSTVCTPLNSCELSPKYLNDASATADIYLCCYTEILELVHSGDVIFHIGAHSVDLALLLNIKSECKETHVFTSEKKSDSKYTSSNASHQRVYIHDLDALHDKLQEYSGKINLVVFDGNINDTTLFPMWHETLVPGGRAIIINTINNNRSDSSLFSSDNNFKLEKSQRVEFLSNHLSYLIFLNSFSVGCQRFIPSIHGYATPPANLVNFPRDYSNPWLPQNLVIPGIRTTNKDILIAESNLIIGCDELKTTPDFGAALCVLGYRLLESDATEDVVSLFILKIEDYLRGIDVNSCKPHTLRWIVSLEYLKAKLLLKVGKLEFALKSFEAVTKLNALSFSPTLMTKIISAYIAIGDISFGFKMIDVATTAYENGARAGFAALNAPSSEWVGMWEHPIKGAMYEAVQIADLANISLLKLRAIKLASKFGHSTLHAFQESKDSVFSVNSKRYAIIEKQGLRLIELESAIDAQALMLEERWAAMQSMEELIRERDRAIAGQATMLEERWAAMQSMEDLIRARDNSIAGQSQMLEERWTAMQSMEELIQARDEVIKSQKEKLDSLPSTTEALKMLCCAILASLRHRLSHAFGRSR